MASPGADRRITIGFTVRPVARTREAATQEMNGEPSSIRYAAPKALFVRRPVVRAGARTTGYMPVPLRGTPLGDRVERRYGAGMSSVRPGRPV